MRSCSRRLRRLDWGGGVRQVSFRYRPLGRMIAMEGALGGEPSQDGRGGLAAEQARGNPALDQAREGGKGGRGSLVDRKRGVRRAGRRAAPRQRSDEHKDQ